MEEYPLLINLLKLKSGIDACIEKQASAPALILIYSAIDTTAWLDSTKTFSTRTDFIHWVDNYLLKAKPLQCKAIDLYAARCGLLHTFTSSSSLSTSKQARVISYAWGKAKAEDMARIMDFDNKSNQSVVIHVDDLYQAWLLGLALWGEDLDRDSDRSARVLVKAAKFFTDVSIKTTSGILSVIDSITP
jgi:hypothetical protein